MAKFDRIVFELNDKTEWIDISADVVGEHEIRSGFSGTGFGDRVAADGYLKFELNNSSSNSAGAAGYYSPGHANHWDDFRAGRKIRVTYIYDGIDFCKFKGKIAFDGIKPDTGQYGTRRTTVTCRDLMFEISSRRLSNIELKRNVTLTEIVGAILENIGVVPEETDYGVGQNAFEVAFDQQNYNTSAAQEILKAAISEFGYVFKTAKRGSPEVLAILGSHDKGNLDILMIPADGGRLLLNTGGRLLLNSGGALILSKTEPAEFDDFMNHAEYSDSANLVNKLSFTVYPRKMGTDIIDLHELTSPMELAAGETKTFTARYKDPDNESSQVAGYDIVDPEANTDYQMNEKRDGDGADRTSDLSVSAEIGATEVEWTVTNNNAAASYVTKLNLRGRGIFTYRSQTITVEDSESQEDYSIQEDNYTLSYMSSLNVAKSVAGRMLGRFKDPTPQLSRVSFMANQSPKAMYAFMFGEIGSRIRVSETQTGIKDKDYLIASYNIASRDMKFINVTWTLLSLKMAQIGGTMAFTHSNNGQLVWEDAQVDENDVGVYAALFMAADGHLETADADSDTTMPCIALALESGTGEKQVLLSGPVTNNSWNWTVGAGVAGLIYVNTLTGLLTQVKPDGTNDIIQPVGWALSATTMVFNPSGIYVVHD